MDREKVHEAIEPSRPAVLSRSLMCRAGSDIKRIRSYQYAISPPYSSCINLFNGIRGDGILNQTPSPPWP